MSRAVTTAARSSRWWTALAVLTGAVLLVDASQGVEAQTVANAYLAIESDLEILPVLNKVDLVHARPEEIAEEIENSIGIDATDALHVSAKTGHGVVELLDRVVRRVPAPSGDPSAPLRALIFDAVYDEYRGVIVYLRVFEGSLRRRAMTKASIAARIRASSSPRSEAIRARSSSS